MFFSRVLGRIITENDDAIGFADHVFKGMPAQTPSRSQPQAVETTRVALGRECRVYGRMIRSNQRKSQPVNLQTQARSTS